MVAGAYVLPPLISLAASRFVIRPLNAWARKRAERQAQQVRQLVGCKVLDRAVEDSYQIARGRIGSF